MTRRPLKPEERRIWAKVAATVTPRPGRAAPDVDAPNEDAAPRKKSDAGAPKTRSDNPVSAGPVQATPRTRGPTAPAEVSADRRVRRGRVEIDARLDLHGMTQLQARAALVGFLARLREHGGRTGLVITGKGRRLSDASADREAGVLRRRLPEWLGEPDVSAMVAGYAPAHRRHGGEGAWYVFIKRRGDQRRSD